MHLAPHQWRPIIHELSPCLLAYFLATSPRPVAAEQVQETFLRLYAKVKGGNFDPHKGSLRMYAYGIARLVRLEAQKRPRAEVPWDEPTALAVAASTSSSSSSTYEDQERAQALRQAIAQLKPIEQEILLLLLDRDLDLAAVATLLSLPLGTVKSHIHRAKQHLRDLLLDAPDFKEK